MKLRFKFIIFFAFLMVILIAGLTYYLNFYFKNYFKNSTLDNFQVLAEVSESSYFAFIKTLEIRIIDWSSDGYIRNAVEEILKVPAKDREPLVKALNGYLKNEKIIYDPNVLIVDILDKDGIVIASSRDNRLGVDEKKEELELRAVRFTEAIQSDFGQTFATPVIFEEDEGADQMIHLTARIFSQKKYLTDPLIPLDAVMLLHFTGVAELRDALIGNVQQEEDRITSGALTDHYKTSDIYLVNKDRLMITPSRFGEKAVLTQKVDTEPVKACLERNKEIKSEYLDYRGEPVLGASMCLKRDNLILVLEVESQEVLAPLKGISRFLILIGGTALILIIIGIALLSSWLLKGLRIITGIAEKISKGDVKERVKINSKDEIGYLGKVFNVMLDNIEKSRKELEEAEIKLKNVNAGLEQRVRERTAELVELKAGLEKTVTDRTIEVMKRLEELEKFKKLTIGRELKMVELKKEIAALKK